MLTCADETFTGSVLNTNVVLVDFGLWINSTISVFSALNCLMNRAVRDVLVLKRLVDLAVQVLGSGRGGEVAAFTPGHCPMSGERITSRRPHPSLSRRDAGVCSPHRSH